MIRSSLELKEIIRKISSLRVEIEENASLGFTDGNKSCENFLAGLINIADDLELENLNKDGQRFPGVDIGDKKAGVAFQVTSTKTSEKVDDTLKMCLAHEVYKAYPNINVFILTWKQVSYTLKVTTTPHFNFDQSQNILDFSGFFKKIEHLSFQKLQRINQFISDKLIDSIRSSFRLSIWNIPQPKNVFFTGRMDALKALENRISLTGKAPLTIAISGLGGIGKTQTAIEFAHRNRSSYCAIFWIAADSEISIINGYVAIASLLRLSESIESDHKVIVNAVIKWLKSHDKWLLIMDNADNPAMVKSYLPISPEGHILLTSRAHSFDMLGIVQPLELQEMLQEDAIEFLSTRTGRLLDNPEEQVAAQQLGSELGYLPLALEQAGAFIALHQVLFKDYLHGFRKSKLAVLNRSTPVTGDYFESVSTTWLINFEQVEKINPASAGILRLSAFLNPDAIPIEFFSLGASELGEIIFTSGVEKDTLTVNILLEPLTRYSLIRISVQSKTYSIHRLVQNVIIEAMDESNRRSCVIRVSKALNKVYPSASYSTWPLCERLLVQAVLLVDYIERYSLTFDDVGQVLNGVACYLRMRGDFDESERIHLKALAIRERDLGTEHEEVATSLNNLALVYWDQFEFSKAEPLLLRALEIHEKLKGPEDPELALNLNNLGMFYVRINLPEKAQPLLERALILERKSAEPEDFFHAIILNNIAELYIRLGDYLTAAKYCTAGLEIREEIGNVEKTWRSYNTMGLIMCELNRFTESELYFEKALNASITVYKTDHPEMILILQRMKKLMERVNKHAEAIAIDQRIDMIKNKYSITAYPE